MLSWLSELFQQWFSSTDVTQADKADDEGDDFEPDEPAVPDKELDIPTIPLDPPSLADPVPYPIPADTRIGPPTSSVPIIAPEPVTPRIIVMPNGRPPIADPFPAEADVVIDRRLKTIGMWVGSSTLRNPKRDVKFAVDHGVNRFDIILNDFSGDRRPVDFRMRNRDQIMRLVDECHKNDVQVAFMSWWGPFRDFIAQGTDQLTLLAEKTECVEMGLDAEEFWNLAKKRLSYAEAGRLTGVGFADLPCPLSVTGIPYTSTSKMKPLMDAATIAWVQSYGTSSSKRTPGVIQPKDVALWVKKFGKNRPAGMAPLQVKAALACYRQTKIKGYSPGGAILTCAEAAVDMGQDEILYWWLVAMRYNKKVARAIASLRDRLEERDSG